MSNPDIKQLLLIGVLLSLFPIMTLAQDSNTVSHELKELVVKDKRAWIENDKVVFVPNKKEKNLSNSPATLLEAMHLPMLKVTNKTISTLGGEAVALFINGAPMSESDIATFWPSRILRVEYIPNSNDPQYAGAKYVINFILKQYEIGSVTRIEAEQELPNNGDYTAATRLEYKKFSFGLIVNPSYSRDHIQHETGSEILSDIYYNNGHYDQIEESYNRYFFDREQDLNIALDAKYQTSELRFGHSLSFKGERNPGSGWNGINSWTPNLFDSPQSYNRNDSKTLSPQATGWYFAKLSNKWYINAGWGYAYAHNESNISNALGSDTPVTSNFSEDVNSARAYFIPVFMLNNNIQLRLSLQSKMDWFDSRYSGTTSALSRQRRGSTSAIASIYWMLRRNLMLSLKPGVDFEYWAIGSLAPESDIRPRLEAALNLSVKKFMFNAGVQWLSWAPRANQANNVIVKSTELLWVAGNPYLKTTTSWMPHLSATWMPNNWFSASFNAYLHHYTNYKYTSYDQAPTEMGGLIKTERNVASFDNMDVFLSLDFRPLKNFSFSIEPFWTYYHSHGDFAREFDFLSFNGSIDYSIGNFGIHMDYRGVQKSIGNTGYSTYRRADRFDIRLKYGNGNWYISAGVADLFHKHYKQDEWLTVPHYTRNNTNFQIGRLAMLNVTYTFGYGKEVSDDSVDGPSEVKSSMLNY